MASAAAKKGPPDLAALVLEAEPVEGGDMLGDDEPSEGDELPPGFQAAAEEYETAEAGSLGKAQALYRAIELCKGGL